MAKQTIIILDFGSGKVLIYPYDPNVWEDGEAFLTSKEVNLRPSNCEWMVVDKLLIEVVTP